MKTVLLQGEVVMDIEAGLGGARRVKVSDRSYRPTAIVIRDVCLKITAIISKTMGGWDPPYGLSCAIHHISGEG